MFTKEVAGTANALVGGWGNLGGGVTQLIMGSVLFPLFKTGMSAETAWRTVCIVPAVVGFCLGGLIMCISDDAPKGGSFPFFARQLCVYHSDAAFTYLSVTQETTPK